MRILAILLAFWGLVGCSGWPSSQALSTQSLNGWWKSGSAQWQVIGDELVGSGPAGDDGFIASHEAFTDFQMSVEFRVDAETNSGIYGRCTDRKKIHPDTCYEFNIWDLHPQQQARTGAIVFRQMPPLAQVNTLEGWNLYRIRIEGDHLQAWINGIKTADLKDDQLDTGFIAFQRWQGGEVRFRNLKLEAL